MFCHALVKHKPPATLPSGGTGQKHGTLMFDGRIGRADMRRIEMHEIHDLPTFPAPLRDLVTDGMQALWNFGNTYQPILGRLMASMKRARTREVLDLCSGGGGPWLRLAREPELQADHGIVIRLTDKYPNQSAFERASSSSGLLRFESLPVDATSVPARLSGFRTIFSSFHHFGPEAACRILSDAVEQRCGVGIFEMARRSPRTILMICLIPFISIILAPAIQPFRWSRLLWTWLIPLVPFVLFYDGIVSCLRAYSRQELEGLIAPLKTQGYEWEIGEECSGFLPVTYLVGYPVGASLQ